MKKRINNSTEAEKWIDKIHCGDALNILKAMPNEFIDLVITSPP